MPQSAAWEAGVAIDIREGSSFDMPRDIGWFVLVTMGQSFHRTVRVATLKMLEGHVSAGGAVVLFHDEHPRTVENWWRRVLHKISCAYGRLHSPHVRLAENAVYRTHEAILLDSASCKVERAGVCVRRELAADDIAGSRFPFRVRHPKGLENGSPHSSTSFAPHLRNWRHTGAKTIAGCKNEHRRQLLPGRN